MKQVVSQGSIISIAVPPPMGHLIDDLPEPKRARWVLRSVFIAIVLLLIWSGLAKVDQVTRASAQLMMSEKTQLVQAPDGGVVTAVHVKEGEEVKAGQTLITLQRERAAAALDDTSAKVAALRITLARLKSEVYGTPLRFDPEVATFTEYLRNQTDLYNRRQKALNDDISALSNILKLAESELAINRQLERSGDVSRADVLKLERSVADIQFQIVNRRNKYFQDAQAEMTKAQEELNTQTEQLRDRKQVLEHTELVAPTDGIVNNIRVNTVGGVARPAETLMELLTLGNQLVVEAKLSPADISFVTVGQEASIKLDAYDSSIFGALRGRVSYISSDVLTEETKNGTYSYYRLRITITEREFKGERANDIHLRPGLSAQVDIKAMERTVLSYITKPITKTVQSAMGER
jgi:adhesin transport system membrane fusion protein